MRAGLALMCIPLVFASPAQACHRFSVWKYPYAQRCEVAESGGNDRSWYVQFVLPEKTPDETKPKGELHFSVSKYNTIILNLPPGTSDEEGRAAAIDLLKEVMGK